MNKVGSSVAYYFLLQLQHYCIAIIGYSGMAKKKFEEKVLTSFLWYKGLCGGITVSIKPQNIPPHPLPLHTHVVSIRNKNLVFTHHWIERKALRAVVCWPDLPEKWAVVQFYINCTTVYSHLNKERLQRLKHILSSSDFPPFIHTGYL